MIYLSGRDLEDLLIPYKAIEAARSAFIAYSSGKITQPQRQVFEIEGNWWGIMPSYTNEYFVVKVVNVIESNKLKNLPSVQGSVVVFNTSTGSPEAVIDGTILTAIRTSAASVLSTEIALRSRNIGTLGIIGAGLEAEYHLKFAQKYFKISKILINARKRHYELARKYGCDAVGLENLLKESDVIYATTSSNSPVVLGRFLKDDFHVVSIGAHTPNSREIDDETIIKVKTFMVDSIKAVSIETGDFIEPNKKGLLKNVIEIGEVLIKDIKIERPSIFKSVGLAAQDNFSAKFALEEALKRGIGIKF
jgi:alanine dehydrogenase